MENLIQDIRFGARMLAKRPAFTAVAVICLGLGIGVNSAIFSMVNTFFFRPLPVEEPDRLARMYTSFSKDFLYGSVSYPDFQDYAAEDEIFEGIIGYRVTAVSLSLEGRPDELAVGSLVSGNYFDVLGLAPSHGRFFRPEEDNTPGTHPVVVVGYSLWQTRLGGKTDVLGQSIRINGHPFTVIGVAPQGFKGVMVGLDIGLYVPFMMRDQAAPGVSSLDSRGSRFLQVTARLKDGLSLPEVQAAAAVVGSRLAQEYPESNEDCRPLLVPESESTLPPQIRGNASMFSVALLALVGIVLLIACVNVANLLSARAASRRREVSVRAALGAGRLRIARQLLTESTLLALLGGAVGTGLAVWATGFLSTFQPPISIPVSIDFSLDYRVLGFTLGVSMLSAIIFGLSPALQGSRPDLVPALKGEELQIGSKGGAFSFSNILVTGQVAMSLLLLICSGLFIRSMGNAEGIDPGFEISGVLVGTLDPGLNGYGDDAGRNLYDRLLPRVREIPGVQSAALGEIIPFNGLGGQQNGVQVSGYEEAEDENMSIDYNIVSPGYFETLEIALKSGRDFKDSDTREAQAVLIVNEAFARRFFGDEDPVGRTVTSRGERTVVGVVETTKLNTLGEAPLPYMYYPHSQVYNSSMNVHLRTQGDPNALQEQLRSEIKTLDSNLPIFSVRSLEEAVAFSLFPSQFGAAMLTIFSGLAIVLSGIGLYGVMAFWVGQRTREIGIRIALGARPKQVLRMVGRHTAAISVVGLALGLGLAVLLTRFLSNFLYGLTATDPLTFVTVTLFLMVVISASATFPALRAMRVNPIQALKYE